MNDKLKVLVWMYISGHGTACACKYCLQLLSGYGDVFYAFLWDIGMSPRRVKAQEDIWGLHIHNH